MAKQLQKPEAGSEPGGADVSSGRHAATNLHSGWLYGLGAAVILLIVFLAGLGLGSHHLWNRDMGPVRNFSVSDGGIGTRRFMMGGGGYAFNNNVSGQTRDEGVVTAVDGSSFTLAANGGTTNVVTNGSTQYQGGNSVKQNDSVIVWGAESNGTLTAAQVVINP